MQVTYSARASRDLQRVVDFASDRDPDLGLEVARVVVDAIAVLLRHPYIGRPIRGALQELVISHGRTGYVALYRENRRIERAEILAIRQQNEAGFA